MPRGTAAPGGVARTAPVLALALALALPGCILAPHDVVAKDLGIAWPAGDRWTLGFASPLEGPVDLALSVRNDAPERTVVWHCLVHAGAEPTEGDLDAWEAAGVDRVPLAPAGCRRTGQTSSFEAREVVPDEASADRPYTLALYCRDARGECRATLTVVVRV